MPPSATYVPPRPATGQTGPVPFGVYVHVPFCARRCDYCAFATWTDRSHLVERYLRACRRQVEAVAGGLDEVTSVFVGGGTPTLVPPQALLSLLEPLPLASGAEVTVEANPDDVTDELAAALARGGVNRVSLGAQSMVPEVLVALGRSHDPANVAHAVAALRWAGIDELNVDVIYGAAGESLADWEHTLTETVALGPDHVSAYALTVEPGTPLWDDPARHPDDDDQADKYLLADALLGSAGLANYEISNWARPGHRCRHNLLYWEQGEYQGIGCAAHSHRHGRRWWAVRTPERFIDLVEEGRSVEAGSEELDARSRALEGLQLALRTEGGVPASAVPEAVRHLVSLGDDGRARLTVEGRLLANEVAVRLRAPPVTAR
jgi:putative oxygen-independent coproporphyrinogen III oxidase